MSTETLTLTDFLLARIADTQAIAFQQMRQGARRHVLNLARAERAIVVSADEHEPELDQGDNGEAVYARVLRHLAAVYADHPDYRDEWRP